MTDQEKLELAYLRYFYGAIERYMGPGADDVYYSIQKDYVNTTGEVLPDGYSEGDI